MKLTLVELSPFLYMHASLIVRKDSHAPKSQNTESPHGKFVTGKSWFGLLKWEALFF
jgi:hypothetical protein